MKNVFIFFSLLFIVITSNSQSFDPDASGGIMHSLFLCASGNAYATGSNNHGQLGNGSPTGTGAQVSNPVQVNGLTNVISVCAGSFFSMALKSDGTVWAWGQNGAGQLGNNSTTDSNVPVQVHGPGNVGFLSGIIALSGGGAAAYALKNDGTVWAWGQNGTGQLGIGNTVNQYYPVQVTALSNIIAIDGGLGSAIALRNDGTVWAWGDNSYGALGDNTNIPRYTPVQVHGINNVGFLTGITAIAFGSYHSMALGTNGVLYTCGENVSGELGNGSTMNQYYFTQATNFPTGLISIDAGAASTYALRNDGTIWSCGFNVFGELGNGTGTTSGNVTQVTGLTSVNSISAGYTHCSAVKSDGTEWGWGRNQEGELGDGTSGNNRLTPVQALLSCPAKVVPPQCKLISIDKATTNGQNSSVALSTLPGYPVITGKNITITGTLNIDQNVVFSGCNIQMAANAKMNLTSGDLVLNNKTHVYSCTSLWDGIYVPAGRTVVINGDAFIEDALNAVVSTGGGVFTINSAIFNNNLIATDVRSFGGSHTGSILNSIVTSRVIPALANTSSNQTVANLKTGNTLTNYTPAILKAPYNDRKGCYGVNVTDVNAINIGSAASSAVLNLFDGIMCGINLTRSNAVIFNNKFQYLLGYTTAQIQCPAGPPGGPDPPCYVEPGFGIKAIGTASTGTNAVYIGDQGTNYPNTFYNTFSAINIYGYQNIDVYGNTIDNTSTGPFGSILNYGSSGVYISSPTANNKIYVSVQPLIRNCANAIYVNRNYSNALSTDLYIRSNTITANSGGYCTNGIYVTDLLNGTFTNTTGSWTIDGNTISETNNCVNLLNVKSPGNNSLSVNYNSCTVRYATTGSINGILTKGCAGIYIQNNHTKCNSTAAALAGGNLGVCGIHLQNSTNMLVKCNQMDDAARSMVFEGTCTSILTTNSNPTVGITTNIMHRAQDGFVLLGSGIIGSQGSASVASNNVWDLPVSSFSRAQTMADGSNATNSILYVSNSSTTLPTNNAQIFPGTFYSATSLLNSTGTPPACTGIRARVEDANTDIKVAELTAYSNELKLMEEDVTKLPLYDNESHWMRKQFVFNELKNNTALKSDASLQNFYNSTKHNYSKFEQVNDKILIAQYNVADNINSSIVGGNTIENNQQMVNSLILKKMLTPSYAYSESDNSALAGIANQCPLSGGNAVYQARVLLMTTMNRVIEFDDNCNQAIKLKGARDEIITDVATDIENKSFNLYPNPNDGNMLLEYSLPDKSTGIFLLYDITGRILNQYTLREGENNLLKISENDLTNGIYFYSIIVDNTIKTHNKIIISK